MPEKRTDKPDIIIISIDSLRADCLDANSDGTIWESIGRPETPAIDGLIRSALRFRNAVSASSWTKPALPSILFSLYPSEHGILETGKTESGGAMSPPAPADVRPLAQVLSDNGYQTIGLTHNAQLDSIQGFERGFDFFTASAGDGDAILETARKIDPFGKEAPAFVFTHFMEPHWPYGERAARKADAFANGRFPFHRFSGGDWKDFKKELKNGRLVLTEEEVRFLRLCYKAAVEDVDLVIGNLLGWLEKEGVREKSLILFTADHGEELFDHGSVGHGQSLYDELTRIPFFLQRPGGDPLPDNLERDGEGTVTRPIGHVDIVPTLLGAAGIAPPEEAAGRNHLDGSAAKSDDRHVFSEVKHKRRYRQSIRGERFKLIRSYIFEKDRSRKSRGDRMDDYNNLDELIADRPHRIERELYDLLEDPRESRNLVTIEPGLVIDLEGRLDRWWRSLRRFGSDRNFDVDAEVISRLEALGYM